MEDNNSVLSKPANHNSSSSSKATLRKALPLLHAICRMSGVERGSLLEFLNFRGRDILYQCIANCVYNVHVSKSKRREIKSKLKSKAKVYTYLANAKNSDERRKKILRSQKGLDLDIVLDASLPLLESVVTP